MIDCPNVLVFYVSNCPGMQTACDARQNGTQCYGAVGGTVDLRLVEKIETGCGYDWRQNNTLSILRIKNNRHVIDNGYVGRSSFDVSNGTFKMYDITRSDEAHYVLTITDILSGITIETKHLNLSVQGKVLLIRTDVK